MPVFVGHQESSEEERVQRMRCAPYKGDVEVKGEGSMGEMVSSRSRFNFGRWQDGASCGPGADSKLGMFAFPSQLRVVFSTGNAIQPTQY